MKKYFDRLYQEDYASFEEILKNTLKKNKKMFIITANPEAFMIGEKDSTLNDVLLDSDTMIVPDGIGIVKAANMLGYPVKERITGIEISWSLLKEGNAQKKSIAILGASKDVKDKMVEKLKTDYPDLKIACAFDGYGKNKDQQFQEIQKKKPDIILVALGIPAQEKLIAKHLDGFDKGIFVGVGGSFDVISGTKKRAPKIFQKMGMEWFYRLMKEPKRIKRFYQSNVKFLFRIRKMKKQK